MAAIAVEVVESAAVEESIQKTKQQKTQELAYQLWTERGCPDGSDQEDWFLAERILENRSE